MVNFTMYEILQRLKRLQVQTKITYSDGNRNYNFLWKWTVKYKNACLQSDEHTKNRMNTVKQDSISYADTWLE